jgi:ADP-ribosylglycohydrolase
MPNADCCDICGETYHRSENCGRIVPRDRVFGSVFGQAIGDAIGHPIEFIEAGTDAKQVSGLLDDNRFTDDTQMFCAIGEAMLDSPPHKGEEEFMVALGKRFVDWRHNPLGGSHRAPGGNCMEAVRKLGTGMSWRETGGKDFKGNGTAMRSGVVGCVYWRTPELAFRIGCLTSVCTHNNLEAILAAGTVAYLVAAQIGGTSFAEAVANALLLCADFDNPMRVPSYPQDVKIGSGYHNQNPWYTVARFGAAYALGTDNAPIHAAIAALEDPTSIVKDGAAVPAVAEAIFFNARFERYRDIVIEAANNSDDTDTIAAISGTIAGARVGFKNINKHWTKKIELAEYLTDLATRLWELSEVYGREVPVLVPHNAVNMANTEDVDTLLDTDDAEIEGEELHTILSSEDEEEYEVEF